MPGFELLIGNQDFNIQQENSKLVHGCIKGDGFILRRFTLNKFVEDKVFYEDDKCILVVEGVILNKSEFLKADKGETWEVIIWRLYLEKGQDFYSLFKGSFSGLLYDKSNGRWIVFTDHIGSKHIYYYKRENQVLISSEISTIYRFFKKMNLKPVLNSNAAYMLLSYGYMLDDNTLCSDIKKLLPGHYILMHNGQFNIKEYYKLPVSFVSTDRFDLSELIEELDIKFRRAIELQFRKDKEYDYKHLVALSGGLDSRMTSWVAHEMGYIDQLNFTFSQSDYLDETIPKKMAADMKHEWIFKSLDNGLFLRDIEEINLITGGNVLFYGLAHGNSMLKLLNFNDLGIVHSGQLGDVVIGSYLKEIPTKKIERLGGAYSNKLLSKVTSKYTSFDNVAQLESTMIYQRAFNGINSGLLASQNYTETISPFYDLDLFEFCMSIPLNVRMNHNLYKKWILKKYPKAAKYVWESTRARINAKNVSIRYRGRAIPVNRILSVLLRKMVKGGFAPTKFHMNPMNYWYKTNLDLKKFQDKYYEENIHHLKNHPILKKDCELLYKGGSGIEKNQVLTFLSALKLFY